MNGNIGVRQPNSQEWYTPPSVFELLKFPTFDLDPCAGSDLSYVQAKTYYLHHGLSRPWSGSIWLNPPYGKGIDKWLEKMLNHNNGIALVPSRTDTLWFHTFVRKADVLAFPVGRITFLTLKDRQLVKVSGNPIGSILVGYGREWADWLVGCGIGYTIDNRKL
jgi:hypothetical protein